MKFKCKCGHHFKSEEIWEETGDLETGPSCEVVGMTVNCCPKCGTSLNEMKLQEEAENMALDDSH